MLSVVLSFAALSFAVHFFLLAVVLGSLSISIVDALAHHQTRKCFDPSAA
jgi:hypothetical protein